MSEETFDCTSDNIENVATDVWEFVKEWWSGESLFNFYQIHYCTFDGNGIGLEIVGIAIYILLIALWFYILGSTADAYLSPALEKIASTLGLSESLAGVTLLALGNGSPDVISSLSAAGSDSGGMFLAVGSLVGGGLFVSGVVSAIVMLSSPKPIHVLGKGLLRDTIFYLIALSVLVIASFVGELNIYFAIIFFAIYVLFVITVVVIDKYESRQKEWRKTMRQTLMVKRSTMGSISNKEQQVLDDADLDEDAYYYKDENDHLVEIQIENENEEDEEFTSKFDRMMTEKTDYDIEDDAFEDAEESVEIEKNYVSKPSNGNELVPPVVINLKIQDNQSIIERTLNEPLIPSVLSLKTQVDSLESPNLKNHKIDPSLTDKIEKTKIEQNKDLSSFIIEDHYEEEDILRSTDKAAIKRLKNISKIASRTKHKIVWSMLKMKKFLKKGVQGEDSFSDMNIFSKIVFILIDAPFDFMRRLTIPPADHEAWNRRIAAVVPITSIFFVFTVTGILDFKSAPPIAFYISEGVALLAAILIWFTTPLNNGPRRGMIVFSVFAFLLSIMWIWFIANVLIDLLGILGLIFGLKPSYLGITVLAWGNSVGDTMANSAVAKKGFARMALVGCFAGPLFNLLMGLGLSLTIKELNGKPPEKFDINDKEAILPMMAIGALILQLLIVIAISVATKFHLAKRQGIIQIIYFLCTIAAISIAAFTFAK